MEAYKKEVFYETYYFGTDKYGIRNKYSHVEVYETYFSPILGKYLEQQLLVDSEEQAKLLCYIYSKTPKQALCTLKEIGYIISEYFSKKDITISEQNLCWRIRDVIRKDKEIENAKYKSENEVLEYIELKNPHQVILCLERINYILSSDVKEEKAKSLIEKIKECITKDFQMI